MRKAHEQRALLLPHEERGPSFAQELRSSHGLAQALTLDRKTNANGQAAYLQGKARQLAYVEEARQRPRPPLENIVAQQGFVGDLRKDATDHALRSQLEKPALQEQRMVRQADFLMSLKTRHEAACDAYEKGMDNLAGECEAQTQEASTRMKGRVDEAVAAVDEMLDPLETTTEHLGEKTEEEVRGVLTALEGVTEQRRQDLDAFAAEIEDIDAARRQQSTALLEKLAEALYSAAHMVPGEIERLIEEKTLELDQVILENQKAVKVLSTKLLVQTLEASKANKVRWHKGLLLWKQKRHVHSIRLVMDRIQSPEYQQPPELEELLGHVQKQQVDVYEGRMSLVKMFFATRLKALLVSSVRSWEEQNTGLNDKTGDAFDNLFEELSNVRKSLQDKSTEMLGVLAVELETHDARAEWGEHQSVGELIDATVRPHLQERLDAMKCLIESVVQGVSKQEESQHHVMTQLLAFFMQLAKKSEGLAKAVQTFESEYNYEVDDCVHDFDEECAKNEQTMKEFKEKIDDAAHYEALDELKFKAFEKLSCMEGQYREHADKLLDIHNRYPPSVADLVREQTVGFCEELGLALAGLPSTPDVGQVADGCADVTAHAAEGEEDEGLPGFEQGTPTGFKVVEKLPLAALRAKVIGTDPTLAPGADAGADEAAVGATERGGGEAEAGAMEGDRTSVGLPLEDVPRLHDGSTVLAILSFDVEWLEEHFGVARSTVFTQLSSNRQYLDRIDIPGACEEVRRQLDQRLRRHTNRKGEVQVEWYVPRYTTVSKHKDKFERHLVEVAQKSQAHDEEVIALAAQMEEAEVAYKEKLDNLRGRLGEAETLPMLTSFERQAGDVSAAFFEECQQILSQMLHLATRAPQELQKTNEAFLGMCRRGEEQYSQTEIVFYGGEVEELNAALERKSQQRSAKRAELEAQVDEKRKVPFEAFTEQFDEAVEQLCATKGYGKKYGKPRRKAQGLCRTLIAHSATVRQNLSELVEYLGMLCSQKPDEPVEVSVLPHFPGCLKTESQAFRLRESFCSSGEPWVFSGEILGVLYIVVSALSSAGTHLRAFKEEHSSKYMVDAIPKIRVLRESEVLVTAESSEEAAGAESELRTGCLEMVLGQLMKAGTFDVEIGSIVADAQKDSQDTFKGAVPEFMSKFLEDMKESAEHSRVEAARGIREVSDRLRDSALQGLGDALFGELTARAVDELRRGAKETKALTLSTWADLDSKRAAHELRLSPGLSNPNAEAQLQELIESEASRAETAQATAKEDRERMAAQLRELCDGYVRRLAATFESVVQLIDRMPLHSHFSPLPGDEQSENPRMSIKRRMRHLQNGTSVDQWGDGLPERTWSGLPLYELRAQLLGGAWPLDEALPEATEEKLQEQTPSVLSFRSPLHKQLFEKRAFYYDRYRADFEQEVRRRDIELAARSGREEAGRRNWQSNVRQLQGDIG